MRIWLEGKIYTIKDNILVVYLEEKDKRNIARMGKEHKVYCEFEEKNHRPKDILELLKKLRPLLEVA